jgi:hypothetical protein
MFWNFLKYGLSLTQRHKTGLWGERCLPFINTFSNHISSYVGLSTHTLPGSTYETWPKSRWPNRFCLGSDTIVGFYIESNLSIKSWTVWWWMLPIYKYIFRSYLIQCGTLKSRQNSLQWSTWGLHKRQQKREDWKIEQVQHLYLCSLFSSSRLSCIW